MKPVQPDEKLAAIIGNDPVPRTEASEDVVVEDEQRHDVGRAVHRRMKGGVVVHAEIAGEEYEGGAHRLPTA